MSDAPVQTEWPVERSEKLSSVPNAADDRPTRMPRLLSSLWIYAYSRGMGSAREMARRCGYDPGFQWLTGLTEVNYHTLADFRVDHQSELDELFVQVLGLLSAEGLITLERAARQRVQRERVERLEKAAAELEIIQQAKVGIEAQAQSRVSETDPEARVMKLGDGGYAPSYNVQLSTDAAPGLIVGMGVTQACGDVHELVPAVQRIERNFGQKPQQMVVDGGFTTRENILEMEVQVTRGSINPEGLKSRNCWNFRRRRRRTP